MQGHLFHIGAVFQSELLGELQTRHAFQNIKDKIFGNADHPDLMIAVMSVLQRQLKRQDLKPEGLIVQRCQPLFNVIDITKFSHGFKIANPVNEMQILNTKRGSPWLTA